MVTQKESTVPVISVAPQVPSVPMPPDLVEDKEWKDACKDILSDINSDRKEVSDAIENFSNLFLNEGDVSNSTKESLIALYKIKSDMADKKTKILELMTRSKLRDNAFPKYLVQNNKIENNGPSIRHIIESATKKGKKDEEK